MASGETSKPHPRHSAHHHSRHDRSRDENSSYEIPDDRTCLKHQRKPHMGNSTLLESNRALQSHARYDIVENWLERTARQSPHPWHSRSQGHRQEVNGDSHPSRPHDTTSPYNKHPRPADPRWSPRHVFPGDNLHQSASHLEVLGLGDPRKSTRRRTAPSDSSFISGFENSTKPPNYGPGSVRQNSRSIVPARSPREAGLAPMYASSTTSHVDEPASFEKRPRRKTREDKYETKKKRDRKQDDALGHDDNQRKRRKRASKKKPMTSSKHVVSNFTSGAVLNDRITVQPHLKPGLFDNGRASRREPISDLAFSEMQFLKHQKRSSQPKALSKSRQRDKRRESREMEEVSSFFLPHGANGTTHGSQPHSLGTRTKHQDLGNRSRQPASARYQGPTKSPPSSRHVRSRHSRVPRTREETIESPSLDPRRSVDDGRQSGRNTTYFTWSSSRRSPRVGGGEDRPALTISESEGAMTPESIRRAMIATGIYRNTGIPLYDDCLTEKSVERGIIEKESVISATEPEDSRHNPSHEPNGSQKVNYRDQAMMTDSPSKYIGPPHDAQITEDRQVPGSSAGSNPQVPCIDQGVARREIVRDTRLGHVGISNLRQSDRTPAVRGVEITTTQQTPELTETDADRKQETRTQEVSDQASITSRDAMPPPPIPHSINGPAAMVHANTGEAGPPEQNIPSDEVATEALQAPYIMNYLDDIHYTRRPVLSCSPTAKSTSNTEQTLPSFNTVSWIPQRTPSARVAENRNISSRLSMKSPIYVDQLVGKLNGGPYQRDLTSKPHIPESMAEFIARIESESQLQPPSSEYGIPDSESVLGKVSLDPAPFDTELLRQQPSDCNTVENRDHNLTTNLNSTYPNSGGSRTGQQYDRESSYIEAQSPQYGANGPWVLPEATQPLEDFADERFEMSSFWRPNQFSQF
ncbi:hypothetical protein F4677DRAFT_23002 [Hypoxylon crocopeplum]|nr:hypothetical protein F4677DRAFT_23002 [Hypoxylon crocopeplum]